MYLVVESGMKIMVIVGGPSVFKHMSEIIKALR